MENKKEQRMYYKEKRKRLSRLKKDELDKKIFINVINSREYRECENILIYVSIGFEVDTRMIIENALANGKKVFIPRVTNEKRVMKFYEINNFDELEMSKFGVYEPKISVEWLNENNSICIVPAFVFDQNGFRIGYGGGYYDYFLSRYNVKTIGIIYNEFIIDNVIINQFDMKVDRIITEK